MCARFMASLFCQPDREHWASDRHRPRTGHHNVPPHVSVYTNDILSMDDDFFKSLGTDFNVVISDMAPSTTGNKFVDSTRSFDLCLKALSIAQMTLTTGGSFVCKIFQGEDFRTFIDSIRSVFKNHKIFKPKSSRKASKEIYVIGFGKK